MPSKKIKFLIAIPFYKNEEFIDAFVSWYQSNPSEHELIDRVVIINDCPEGKKNFLQEKCLENNFEFISNQKNLGYLQSANIAVELAVQRDCHLILLNSDTVPYSNFVSEIASCFDVDSNLGIVAPRSNNATICNLYNEPRYFEGAFSFDNFVQDFNRFRKVTPQVSYVPTATGFCFCVRSTVLSIFGGFDVLFGAGYEEENEYCMRVSERGLSVGIANNAFVAHMEGKSFQLTSSREKLRQHNKKVLSNQYPYYFELIEQYAASVDAQCIRIIAESLENKEKLLIDATGLSPIFNGTNKLIVEFMQALSALGYSFDALASKESIEFHGIANMPGLEVIDRVDGIYNLGIRIGQPFNDITLKTVPLHSIFSICIFFDVIAHDCPQLRSENSSIDSIWSSLPYWYSDISFISRYAKEQFVKKFGEGSACLDAALLPITITDLSRSEKSYGYDHDIVFVIGNKFKHKAVDLVFEELPKVDNRIYYVLGEKTKIDREDIKYLSPGIVSESEMTSIMSAAKFIVFPTFSEGFGFPVLEALQYKKIIYCRPLLPFLEIYNAVDDKFKKFIKFVPDFTLQNNELVIDESIKPKEVFASYLDYVSHVIKNTEDRSAGEIYHQLRSRLILIRNPGGRIKRTVTLVFLYPVYVFFKKIPFARDIASFLVRRISL